MIHANFITVAFVAGFTLESSSDVLRHARLQPILLAERFNNHPIFIGRNGETQGIFFKCCKV